MSGSSGKTTWDELHGQERALAMLRHALTSDRVAHAYLFAGPTGIGKARAALVLAQALNCLEPGGPCGLCAACDRIARDLHPDVLRVEPTGAARQITKESIDVVRQRLTLPPHEGRARVIIIDEAERLNPTSANQILKTLEEPPPRTVFVLVSAAPEQLLPTIRSRCQRVRFAPLAASVVARVLRERHAVAAARSEELAALAGGSLGRALASLDEEAMAARRAVARRLRTAARGTGAAEVLDAAAELKQEHEKETLADALDLLTLYWRDAALLAGGADVGRLVHADDEGLAVDAARGGARCVAAARATAEAATALRAFAAVDLTLEQLVFQLRAA